MERTFMFVDLAGFSALTESHGDETAADLVERFTALVDEVLEGDAVRVATIGDAVFLAARNPQGGLTVLSRLWRRVDAELDFPVLRAGIHHGDAAERGGQFYGTAVNLAARLAAQAAGGELLATATVADVAKQLGCAIRSLGLHRLKNLRESTEIFSVALGARPLEVIDPVCRMRVAPERAPAHLESQGQTYWFCSRACLEAFIRGARPR